MIVVSILTALALEHAAQSWHHSHLAHDAEGKIESELRHNLAELHKTTEANAKQLKELQPISAALRQAIKGDKAQKEAFNEMINKRETRIGFELKSPNLRREAWEVAVASQAASWLSAARLQRYSGLHSQQRDTQESVRLNTQLTLGGTTMFRTLRSAEIGNVDPVELYHALGQMQTAIDSVQDELLLLEKEMTVVLAKT